VIPESPALLEAEALARVFDALFDFGVVHGFRAQTRRMSRKNRTDGVRIGM
jgi:hypothetical protein